MNMTNSSCPTRGEGAEGADSDNSAIQTLRLSLVITISGIIVIYDALVLKVLSKCKRIAVQINSLFISYIVSDILVMLTITVHSMVILVSRHDSGIYKALMKSRIICATILMPVAWASITAISVERLLALTLNIKYARHINTRNIRVSIAAIWAVNVVPPLSLAIILINNSCKWDANKCDMYSTMKPLRLLVASVLIVYEAVIVASNIKISLIFKRHATRLIKNLPENNNSRIAVIVKQNTFGVLKATKYVLTVAVLFVVLNFPLLLNATLFEFAPDLLNEAWQSSIQTVSFIGLVASSFVTSFIYMWKLKECKMNLYLLCRGLSRRCRDEAETLRIEVFDIYNVRRQNLEGSRSQSTTRHDSCV